MRSLRRRHSARPRHRAGQSRCGEWSSVAPAIARRPPASSSSSAAPLSAGVHRRRPPASTAPPAGRRAERSGAAAAAREGRAKDEGGEREAGGGNGPGGGMRRRRGSARRRPARCRRFVTAREHRERQRRQRHLADAALARHVEGASSAPVVVGIDHRLGVQQRRAVSGQLHANGLRSLELVEQIEAQEGRRRRARREAVDAPLRGGDGEVGLVGGGGEHLEADRHRVEAVPRRGGEQHAVGVGG